MPSKRTPRGHQPKARITPEVIASWQACDSCALHSALRLHPWNSSPLPREVTCLGVDQGAPPAYLDAFKRRDWRQAQALQRELLKVAGWPTDCRVAYEENLREAEEWAAYCQELIDHPERGPAPGSTGADPVSRRQALEEAEADVAYRKKLLADLG